MALKIRSAVKKDFKDVLGLNRSMYAEFHSNPNFGDFVFLKQPSRQRMLKWFNTLLQDVRKDNALYYVAELDGKVVGHCFVRRESPGSELSHVGVFSILVGKDHRKMGVGKKLLDHAIKESRGKFEILHLRVFKPNKIAKALYKSRGFRSFGIAPRFIKRKNNYIDREYMYLPL